jgi:UDP-galactopyranose mutase
MNFLVLSHLRWKFVYQRPQHLLSRCAKNHRVLFWEEPIYSETAEPKLRISAEGESVVLIVPDLPVGTDETTSFKVQRDMLRDFMSSTGIDDPVLWYYTPMARNFTRDIDAAAIVYDCMDELSGFRGAPPGLRAAEKELFEVADLVFTGGRSLFEAKQNHHPSVHCFPSSIDTRHFQRARSSSSDPSDQHAIGHPRIGYCGVIDERIDLELIAGIAAGRPEWRLIMLGPVVKISDADLPQAQNIHYLGGKPYNELPDYMAGWDVAMMPFARNESTRFISPTKTPEYLAAGLPVVSTSINDVVRPYGQMDLVKIADSPQHFIAAIEGYLAPESADQKRERLARVDDFLQLSSWDRTWEEMEALILKIAKNAESSKERHQTQAQVG